MKNNRLKNSLIAAGIAVLAGVLVFSVNAAMGDAPGYNPPGSGVSPVFSGLEVTGNIDTSSVTASGSISNDGPGWPLLSIDDSVVTTGYFEVQGQLRAGADFVNPYSAVPPKGTIPVGLPVNINDDLDVTGDIQLGVGSSLGSVYTVSSSTSGVWYFSDSCHSDDILLSCGGYSSAGLRGLYPFETVCMVYPASSAPTVFAYLTCLDPEGTRTGLNPL
ncbi:MAG: hypothetical protein ABID64_03695 [Nitrospirota bacterium]